jgi:heme-degrading monooxygenase HmoA
MSAAYVLVWEFRVRAEFESAFEAAYGPTGEWAKLFARATGYLGTDLLRDARGTGRYLTIDRWVSAEAFERFRAEHGDEYVQLDARCEPWTEQETAIGAWTLVGA